jgi:HlyD family secretion protein
MHDSVPPAPPIQPRAPPVPGRSPARKRHRAAWAVVGIAALLTGAGGTVAYLRQRDPAITVQTEKIESRNLTEVVMATGKIQPVVLVKISPEVSGEIIELPLREGQNVKKGDLLLKIKPDFYVANCNSAEANFQSSLAVNNLARANLNKAETDLKRNQELFANKLISESQILDSTTLFNVAKAQYDDADHKSDMAKAAHARAQEELSKTIILSPITGTISKLNSLPGERVVGTATMAGTEVMTVANLEDMEARVDLGEVDVVLIAPGQKATMELDSFRDRKFTGVVTEIANTAKTTQAGSQQEATKFEVRIRIQEKEVFRPGMSVTANIETRSRTNVITVPIQSVTTRVPKKPEPKTKSGTASILTTAEKKKQDEANKPVEVVFLREGGCVKMVQVRRGISDETYVEIEDGLSAGQEVVSGGYKAINRELEDGKKIKLGPPKSEPAEDKK